MGDFFRRQELKMATAIHHLNSLLLRERARARAHNTSKLCAKIEGFIMKLNCNNNGGEERGMKGRIEEMETKGKKEKKKIGRAHV